MAAHDIVYTEEMDKFLIDNYYSYSSNAALVKAFNKQFNTTIKYATISSHCSKKLNLKRFDMLSYSKDELEWLKINASNYFTTRGIDYESLIADYEILFNKTLTPLRVYTRLYKLGIDIPRTTLPMVSLPAGSERKHNGIWYIKLDNTNTWMNKSRYLYEQHYNVKLAPIDKVYLIDNNEDNLSIDNFILLDASAHAFFVRSGFSKIEDLKLREAALIYSKLQSDLKKRG